MLHKRITVWIAVVAMLIAVGGFSACGGGTSASGGLDGGGGSGAGEDSGSDDGGEEEAAPSPPTDAPISVEFNSVRMNNSLFAKSLTNFTSNESDNVDPIDNCSTVQGYFVTFNELLTDDLEPNDTDTSYDLSNGIHVDVVSNIGDLTCSGDAVTVPICLKLSYDDTFLGFMRVETLNSDITAWYMFDPTGDSLATMKATADKTDIIYLKTSMTADEITLEYSYSDFATWADLSLKELEITCSISDIATPQASIGLKAVSTSSSRSVHLTKNDRYSDEFNGIYYRSSDYDCICLKTRIYDADSRDETEECIEADASACVDYSHDFSSDTYADLPSDHNAAELESVEGHAADSEDEEIVLSWTANPNATSYNVYWGTSAGVTKSGGTQITGITGTTYTHSSLANGTDYHYIVTAVNGSSESERSLEVTARPQYDINGTADTDFSDDGIVVLDVNSLQDALKDVTIDANNNIYATGQAEITDHSRVDSIVWKVNSDGSADTEFGTESPSSYSLWNPGGGRSASGYAITINNGEIYTVGAEAIFEWLVVGEGGFERWTDQHLAIWDYDLAEGLLNTDFASPDGYVIGATSSTARRMSYDRSGNLVIAGSNGANYMAIWKYDLDGDPVTSFGVSGRSRFTDTLGANQSDNGQGVALDDEDRILVSGFSHLDDDYYSRTVLLWRLLPDGSLDVGDRLTRGFGESYDANNYADGFVKFTAADFDGDLLELAPGRSVDECWGLTVTTDEQKRIWVVGQYRQDNNLYVGAIWRFTPNGACDTTFGIPTGVGNERSCYQHMPADGTAVFTSDVAFDLEGRVLVGGKRGLDAAIWRMDENGDYDVNFGGGDGYALFGVDNGQVDQPNSMQLDNEGKAVLGGWQYDAAGDANTGNMVIWKSK